MSAYLVRLKPDQVAPRDLVGIFVADSVEELAEYVDECCDTFACEYAELPAGGVYLSKRAVPVPFGPPPEDREVHFLKGASPTESWFEAFFTDRDQIEWYSLGEAPWKSDEERQELIDSAMAKFIAYKKGSPPQGGT